MPVDNEDIRVALRGWFAERAAFPRDGSMDLANYFEAKLIDSLQLIELIEWAEARFKVKFSEDDFQDRQFSTVAGLAGIIGRLGGRG